MDARDGAHDHAHDHGHGHGHGHERALRSAGDQRRLLAVMLFGAAILVTEVIAGFVANSLVLLSDAAHMSTDVAALALAYAAVRIATRPATSSKSFGYYRAEVVAAFINALALWLITAYFLWESWKRLRDPPAVDGVLVAIVGGGSLVANLVMAAVLHGRHEGSVNIRSAYVHVLSDALGSLAALVAGIGIWLYDARWLDPATTLVIAVLILLWTWRLTRDTLHILLEGTPTRVKPDAVRASIESVPGVLALHDLHVWSLTTGVDSLSAHIVVQEASEGPRIVRAIRERLAADHALGHVTIEVETPDGTCVSCD